MSDLKELKEIHLFHLFHRRSASPAWALFEQKQRYGLADLKIYFGGLLLNGPHDLDIRLCFSNLKTIRHLVHNFARLANEIPFCDFLRYKAIEQIDPASEIGFLKRLTRLNEIRVDQPVKDIQRFLNLLKNNDNIFYLVFRGYQSQDLFDGLPDHCAVQWLVMFSPQPPDFGFLFRLKHLAHLYLHWQVDTQTIGRILNEFEFLTWAQFWNCDTNIIIRKCQKKRIKISFDDGAVRTLPNAEAAIRLLLARRKEGELSE